MQARSGLTKAQRLKVLIRAWALSLVATSTKEVDDDADTLPKPGRRDCFALRWLKGSIVPITKLRVVFVWHK